MWQNQKKRKEYKKRVRKLKYKPRVKGSRPIKQEEPRRTFMEDEINELKRLCKENHERSVIGEYGMLMIQLHHD